MLILLRRNGESIIIGEGKDQVTVRFLDPAEKDLASRPEGWTEFAPVLCLVGAHHEL